MDAANEEVDRKRPRIEYEMDAERDRERRNYVDHPSLYFDDGNIILKPKSSTTIFRVHRSILAKHSSVFDEVLTGAMAEQPPTKFRDCYMVEVEEDLDDLAALLTTIYEGIHVNVPAELNVENFPAFAGLLRISTKYKVERIRQLLIDHLHVEWPSALEKHDAKTAEFSARYLARANADDVIVHPASVIALLRDCDYTSNDLLAPLFYDLSTRTWQFGGQAAGHHLAPLRPLEMEKLVVGIVKLRSHHSKLAEPPSFDHPGSPGCRPAVIQEWVKRAYPLVHRTSNFMCTPIEDWAILLAQIKATPWAICPACHKTVVQYCEQARTQLWASVLTVFS